MKRIWILFISLFLIPIFVNAETLTYEVCESGCEYSSLGDVGTNINSLGDLSDKDIIININSDIINVYGTFGSTENPAKSIILRGNNHNYKDSTFSVTAEKIEIDSCNNIDELYTFNSSRVIIKNTTILLFGYLLFDSNNQVLNNNEINLSEILDIDEYSLNNLKFFSTVGNIKIENMNLIKSMIVNTGGTINIYNSSLNKVFNSPHNAGATTNIYNSEFNTLKYKNFTTKDTYMTEMSILDESTIDFTQLNYDIYDVNISEDNLTSNTMVYFDKESNIKPYDKVNLVEYLDYYTEDKEIEYTIEDESIAKIENKELIGLKEGSTKVTVTTDEGHVVYRINLVVEKETIPEKIDKMTIKVPITGSKIKVWVVVVSILLLAVIGVCISILIKRKK